MQAVSCPDRCFVYAVGAFCLLIGRQSTAYLGRNLLKVDMSTFGIYRVKKVKSPPLIGRLF